MQSQKDKIIFKFRRGEWWQEWLHKDFEEGLENGGVLCTILGRKNSL